MPYFSHDTIAQIGTPPGRGLAGALRLSGPDAFALLRRTTTGLESALNGKPSRSAHSCGMRLTLSRRRGDSPARAACVCPARAYIMPGPASYTRDNVAEIHLPGAPVLLRAGLTALIEAGARPAAPGEFTFRAFRNGRLSLGQAEAVEAVIRAADDADCRRALARLGDRGRGKAEAWLDRTLDLAARMEAALDFSEEELEGDAAADLARIARELEEEGCALAEAGAAAPDIPRIALVGHANAGKSSLFNALVGEETTLVSPRAATTRDSLRRDVLWHGNRFALFDNPGYHPGMEGAGGEASDNAFRRLGGADLSCWVVDGSRRLDTTDRDFLAGLSGAIVIAITKSDLPRATAPEDAERLAAETGLRVRGRTLVSATTGDGVEKARRLLAEAGRTVQASGQWNGRESLELSAALASCRRAADELAGPARLELAAEDMRAAAAAFSRALGNGYAEEALQRIFSSFCLGK